MYKYHESKDALDIFLDKCLQNIQKINIIKTENENIKTVFSVSSTAKQGGSLIPYVTPIRQNRYFTITGCVVYTQTQAILVAKLIDGKVDIVIVDAEKKIPMLVSPDLEILPEDVLKEKQKEKKCIEIIETGNLSLECYTHIKKSKLYEFKPNDITVDAVWSFVCHKLDFIAGKKIAIIGAGNIGSKLALKFVETGVNVTISRRNHYKGYHIANTLNLIKPKSTISSVVFNENILNACFLADVIIGCTDGNPVIEWEHIAVSLKDSLLIDVGKGSIYENAIEKALDKNKEVYRADISAALDGHLITLIRNDDIISRQVGIKKMGEYTIVSGGIMGRKGDVVVDDINNPKFMIGIANGKGDFIKENNDEHKNKVKKIKEDLKLI